MIDKDKIELAVEYFNKAYQLHMIGNIKEAIDAYRKSINYYPTPKAHTFLAIVSPCLIVTSSLIGIFIIGNAIL